jgi:hypothetical protein
MGWERFIALGAAVFCFGVVCWAATTAGFGLVHRLRTSVRGDHPGFCRAGRAHMRSRAGYTFWLVALISQTLFALIIFFILTKWWVPKKHEFHSPSRA